MRVRATQDGFFERYIYAGQRFDVPEGSKASWFVREDININKPAYRNPKGKTNGDETDDLV